VFVWCKYNDGLGDVAFERSDSAQLVIVHVKQASGQENDSHPCKSRKL